MKTTALVLQAIEDAVATMRGHSCMDVVVTVEGGEALLRLEVDQRGVIRRVRRVNGAAVARAL